MTNKTNGKLVEWVAVVDIIDYNKSYDVSDRICSYQGWVYVQTKVRVDHEVFELTFQYDDDAGAFGIADNTDDNERVVSSLEEMFDDLTYWAIPGMDDVIAEAEKALEEYMNRISETEGE